MSISGASRRTGASLKQVLQLAFAALLGLACSPTASSGAGAAPLSCYAGQTAACSCATGAGVMTCTAAGVMGQCACGTGGASSVAGGTGAGGAPPVTVGQLPCDVSAIVSTHCLLCHTNPPQYTAPMPLLTWSDFHAMGKRTVDKTVLELVSTRIQSTTSPMPPAANTQLTAAEKSTLLNWINAGAPPAVGPGCDLAPGGGGAPNTGSGGVPGSAGYVSTAGAGGTVPGGGGAAGSVGGMSGGGGYGPVMDGPADCQEYFEFTAHNGTGDTDKTPYQVPSNAANDGNQYTCFYFDPPYKPDSQGLWFWPIIKNTAVLHHWLLYATDNKAHVSGTSAPCSAIEAGSYLIAGWAPGASPSQLPPDVGLSMPQGPNGGLILEMHHFNPDPTVMQTDTSGVRFCTAPANTRPHTAGVHFTGSEGICLNPNSQQEVSGTCNPQTDKGDIHIVNVWPHMHKLGTRQQLTITRADGTVEMLHDQPFDFNSQVSYPKDVVIHPGDSINTNCWYNNTTTEKVPFGENTQDEMCYGFVTAWPAGALAVDPTKIDPIMAIGQGIQQTRRCMNLTSIFQSCNGLADYPVVK